MLSAKELSTTGASSEPMKADGVGWRPLADQPLRRSWFLPGIPWVIAGLGGVFLVGMRKLLFLWEVPISQRLVAMVGGSAGALMIVWGTYWFTRSQGTGKLFRPAHLLKINLWRGLLVALFIYGFLYHNAITETGNEFIMLWIISAALVVGGDDRFWYAIAKPLTVIFYLAALLVFLYYDTPLEVTTTPEGTFASQIEYMSARYLGTLGMEFRALAGAGLFLGFWGALSPRNDIWRGLQILAIFIAAGIEVVLFKFRGAVVVFALAGLSLLLFRPFLERRRRPGMMAILVALIVTGSLIFLRTQESQFLIDRFSENEAIANEGMFSSRNIELAAYMSDMKAQVLVGHGLGGYFNAYDAFRNRESLQWGTLHYGLLVFTLKGGVLMLGLFLAFLWPGFYIRPRAWYQNRCNLVAALMFPILLFQFALGPIALSINSIMAQLPAMMVLARFGRRTELDVPKGSPSRKSAPRATAALSPPPHGRFHPNPQGQTMVPEGVVE